jgi:hypothetical protein
MQLFCPACQSAFSGAARCPRCGGLLLMPHEVAPDAQHHRDDNPPPVRPTAGGRVGVGIVLALGLYLALRKLATGIAMGLYPGSEGWWLTFHGLLAVHAAQVLAVVFGAVVAAAGRTHGYPLGFAVGAICGALFLGFELLIGAPANSLVLYIQTPLLAVLGLIAGAIGSRIWGAAPHLNYPMPTTGKLSSIQLLEEEVENPPPPTQWVRILGGAVIMILGVTAADQFRSLAQKHSMGMLKVQTVAQGEFITWQIAAFAVLFGGIAAGSGTNAGLRHGFLAGILGGAGIFGVCMKFGGALPPVEWWLYRLSLDELPLMAPAVIAAIAGGVMLVSIAGGWLGGALFPELAPENMRKRMRPGLD